MDYPSTPKQVFSTPSKPSPSLEYPPGTPKPPFDPPRRRSSLAFSSVMSTPVPNSSNDEVGNRDIVMQTPDHTAPNIGRKISIATPVKQSNGPLGHVTRIQRCFQSAKASLHLDMHFAASPIGSIDSRLPTTQSPTLTVDDEAEFDSRAPSSSARSWRYSTVPQLLATTSLDVREPLPDSSPMLPAIASQPHHNGSVPLEPTSSGFASPVDEVGETAGVELPPLPPSSPPGSSPPGSIMKEEGITTLEGPMTDLKVDDDSYPTPSADDHMLAGDGSDQQSVSMSDSPIFLSQSAKTAAESARVKRGLQTGPCANLRNMNASNAGTARPSTHISPMSELCPDPAVHASMGLKTCPDPSIHTRAFTPRPLPYHNHNRNARRTPELPPTNRTPKLQAYPRQPLRASATGSPMPFSRPRAPISPILPEAFPRQSHPVLRSPGFNRISRPCRPSPASIIAADSEHFQPGWYNLPESTQRDRRSGGEVYSFSTAAAKVTGEPAAPDWRIRDSYRTDTLTPLVKPLNRYRKNGLGAEIIPRGTARFYGSPALLARPLGRTNTYRDRNDYDSIERVRFRSSPPRPSTIESSGQELRKRRRNPRAYTPELDTENSLIDEPRSEYDADAMLVNDETRAAVRMSIFGSNTPEALHGEREGIKELSPNVSTWRKGMRGGPQSRKKRRPSYWDGDLKEVKESPAGRGGIASSPTISKRSMIADLEDISNRSVAVSVKDYAVTDNNSRASFNGPGYARSMPDDSLLARDNDTVEMTDVDGDTTDSTNKITGYGFDPIEVEEHDRAD